MPTIVRMPEVLTGMTDAALLQWHVSVGDQVKVGQPLAEVETEKAVVDYESEMPGVVAGFLVELGHQIRVGEPILVLAEPGESAARAMSAATGTQAQLTQPPPVQAPASEALPSGGYEQLAAREGAAPVAERRFASPIVRQLARRHEVDLHRVTGTGPGGRIVRRDIESHLQNAGPASPVWQPPAKVAPPVTSGASESSAPPPFTAGSEPADGVTEIPHTGMRRAIARRLSESKATVPHFYLSADLRVDELLALRQTVNDGQELNVSVNDFVLKAVAGAFAAVPEANVIWTEESLRRFDTVSVGVAVAVDGGLATPVVRSVDRLSVSEISRRVKDLVGRARAGRLRQEELEGGSFCVSNLGMYGVERFSAIINPPHSGILAVGASTRRPVVADDGSVTAATVMTVTLSGDHRAIDGAVAARWLQELRTFIEHPVRILV